MKALRKAASIQPTIELLSYGEVLASLPERKHILLGNGFSIGCDPVFQYTNLFDYACQNGLTEHVRQVFQYLGTNNFEGVMRLLEDGKWLCEHYQVIPTKGVNFSMESDLQSVKNALVAALASTHLPNTGSLSDEKKTACAKFLEPYFNIFTTNYDLLLYWVAMHGQESLRKMDGFGDPVDDPGSDYLVFQEHIGGNKGMFFLHGALHLYVSDGEVCKYCWNRTNTPLIELIQEGLRNHQYPLFVAEGAANKKLQQIEGSSYLSYCLGKLHRIEGSLVVYGHALGPSDLHIVQAIGLAPKLEHVYIGLFSEPTKPDAKATTVSAKEAIRIRNLLKAKRPTARDLNLHFFDSKTTPVWH